MITPPGILYVIDEFLIGLRYDTTIGFNLLDDQLEVLHESLYLGAAGITTGDAIDHEIVTLTPRSMIQDLIEIGLPADEHIELSQKLDHRIIIESGSGYIIIHESKKLLHIGLSSRIEDPISSDVSCKPATGPDRIGITRLCSSAIALINRIV
jgi:hypothetical protein